MATRTDGYPVETGPRRDKGMNGESDVAHLRADIQETRERMSHTVEDIGERLNPDRLKSEFKHNLRDATIGKAEHMARAAADRVDDTRHSIMDTIRDNPIPAAMVGIGLGWLFVNGRREESDYTLGNRWRDDYRGSRTYRSLEGGYEWGADGSTSFRGDLERGSERDMGEGKLHRAKDRVAEIAHEARDTMGDVADRAQDALADTRERARERAHELRHEARRGSHRLEDRVEHAMRDSPLAVGAAAAALGLAVGLTAPTTRRESEMMGPVRDRMIDRAKHATQEASEKVRDVAQHVKHGAEETAKEELGLR